MGNFGPTTIVGDEIMSHTTQLRDGWIAMYDGPVDDESGIEFKRIDENGKCYEWCNMKYHIIRDFFAEQIGYDLESLFDDVDAAGLIDNLIKAKQKQEADFPKDEPDDLDMPPGEITHTLDGGPVNMVLPRTNPFPIKATLHFTNIYQYNVFMKWVRDINKHYVVIEKDM